MIDYEELKDYINELLFATKQLYEIIGGDAAKGAIRAFELILQYIEENKT